MPTLVDYLWHRPRVINNSQEWSPVYPLVISQFAMENHHFEWENPLSMAIFNSYVGHYQRVNPIKSH